jgi:hypothetical protein
MLASLLKVIALKDVVTVLVQTAKIARAAREVIADSKRGARGGVQALAAGGPEQLAAEVARLESLVAEQARVTEQASAQVERLAVAVRRVALQALLALAAGIAALIVALLVAFLK